MKTSTRPTHSIVWKCDPSGFEFGLPTRTPVSVPDGGSALVYESDDGRFRLAESDNGQMWSYCYDYIVDGYPHKRSYVVASPTGKEARQYLDGGEAPPLLYEHQRRYYEDARRLLRSAF